MPDSDKHQHRAAGEIPYRSADGTAYTAPTPLRDLVKTLPLRVLSRADFEFWQTYGYVVVPNAITPEAAAALLKGEIPLWGDVIRTNNISTQ
jgi:hypothetical protein